MLKGCMILEQAEHTCSALWQYQLLESSVGTPLICPVTIPTVGGFCGYDKVGFGRRIYEIISRSLIVEEMSPSCSSEIGLRLFLALTLQDVNIGGKVYGWWRGR
ncbi:hypothetical protein LIER_25650 [Lithospermum erythrorhizon]|uniref:Uncharacterized protein n=1 Tax=Lithospermum erythrorhizon TaxID=34254 RepID=A0AAV3R7M5_LITER